MDIDERERGSLMRKSFFMSIRNIWKRYADGALTVVHSPDWKRAEPMTLVHGFLLCAKLIMVFLY